VLLPFSRSRANIFSLSEKSRAKLLSRSHGFRRMIADQREKEGFDPRISM
jgi:hypothetical protein